MCCFVGLLDIKSDDFEVLKAAYMNQYQGFGSHILYHLCHIGMFTMFSYCSLKLFLGKSEMLQKLPSNSSFSCIISIIVLKSVLC